MFASRKEAKVPVVVRRGRVSSFDHGIERRARTEVGRELLDQILDENGFAGVSEHLAPNGFDSMSPIEPGPDRAIAPLPLLIYARREIPGERKRR